MCQSGQRPIYTRKVDVMITNLLLGGIFLLLLVYGGAHAWAAIEEALTERAVRAYVKQALDTLNQQP